MGLPRARIAVACARRGEPAVTAGCVTLLGGGEVDDELVLVLGGPHALAVLDGRDKPYWLRVWGARGLLYAWQDHAAPAVIAAMADESWRVREMAAKVASKRRVDEAAPALASLRGDAVARVRAAAERALVALATPAR